MSDPRPDTERPYKTDDAWSRAVFARRTGQVAAFLAPHLRAGMRLLDCGCGPGSITVDLAQAVAPGDTIGIDLREDALAQGRALARERRSQVLKERAREGRVERAFGVGQLIDARRLERDIGAPSLLGERAPLREGVFSQVDPDRFAWRHRLGKVDSDRAGSAPAVEESHPGSEMRREKRGRLAGAAGVHGLAPLGVDSVGALGTRDRIGHGPSSGRD